MTRSPTSSPLEITALSGELWATVTERTRSILFSITKTIFPARSAERGIIWASFISRPSDLGLNK